MTFTQRILALLAVNVNEVGLSWSPVYETGRGCSCNVECLLCFTNFPLFLSSLLGCFKQEMLPVTKTDEIYFKCGLIYPEKGQNCLEEIAMQMLRMELWLNSAVVGGSEQRCNNRTSRFMLSSREQQEDAKDIYFQKTPVPLCWSNQDKASTLVLSNNYHRVTYSGKLGFFHVFCTIYR